MFAFRMTLPPLVTAVGLFAILTTTPSAPAEAETLMQCMTKCVQYEGGNSATNKATCKSRCAESTGMTSGAANPAQPRDCMKEFKACKKGMKSSSAAYKACKQRLMSCK
ncbi:MAG: hypothetical protein ACTSV1_00765 [Alphaproteobacteria bacterium]